MAHKHRSGDGGEAAERDVTARGSRSPLRTFLTWAGLVLLLILLAVAGFGTYLYFDTQSDVHEGAPDSGTTEPEEEGKPYTVLLAGSDSRAGLTKEEQVDLAAGTAGVKGERADTLIVAHVDPDTKKVTMVQLPRDLYVPLLNGRRDRINTALEDGTDALVRNVEDLTGLEMNHFIMVDIAGFRDLVDAIDGVDLCLTRPIEFDEHTGIEVTREELPLVHFDGERAIRFVRSRNFPNGDLGRIQNQQKLVSAALVKVTSPSILLNPARVLDLQSVASESITTDRKTSLFRLRSLLTELRNFDPDRYEAYTAPTKGNVTLPDGRQVLKPDMPKLKEMFAAIGRNESPSKVDGLPRPLSIPDPPQGQRACRT